MLSPMTIRWLKFANWSEDYRWASEPIFDVEMRKLEHQPNEAARMFLARYGGLTWHGENPYQPNAGTLMCHTNALRVAGNSFPGWYSPDSTNAINSTLCPIGEWGYGCYLVGMDERGQVFGMDQLMVWKEFGDSGEDFLNEQSHDWRWPMRGRRG